MSHGCHTPTCRSLTERERDNPCCHFHFRTHLCPVLDWVWNNQCCVNIVYQCVCNYTPRNDVSALRSSFGLPDWTRSYGTHCIVFTFPTRKLSWVFDWLSLRCSGPWINHLPAVCRHIYGKFIVNKLVYKSDRMENCFLSMCIYILNFAVHMRGIYVIVNVRPWHYLKDMSRSADKLMWSTITPFFHAPASRLSGECWFPQLPPVLHFLTRPTVNIAVNKIYI